MVPFRTRPAEEIERDGWATLEGEREMETLAEGRIEFARLDHGRWIVERWRLRAPEIELQGGEPLVVAIVESMAEVRRR